MAATTTEKGGAGGGNALSPVPEPSYKLTALGEGPRSEYMYSVQ